MIRLELELYEYVLFLEEGEVEILRSMWRKNELQTQFD